MARQRYNSGAWTPERAQQQAQARAQRQGQEVRTPTPALAGWRAERADPNSRLHAALYGDVQDAVRAGIINNVVDTPSRGTWATSTSVNWQSTSSSVPTFLLDGYDPVAFRNIRVQYSAMGEQLVDLASAASTAEQALRDIAEQASVITKLCDCGNPGDPHWNHSNDGCDFIEHDPDMTLRA
jgi:hypothetical protein